MRWGIAGTGATIRTYVRFKGDELSTVRESARQPEPASGGDVPAAGDGASGNAARESRLDRLLQAWWLDERPAWTERDWWETPLRDQVRTLLWLPAGPLLATALSSVESTSQCPDPHDGESLPGLPAPGHARGWPCACMVVLTAAWEACAAWAAAGSAVALVHAAGPSPVVLDLAASGQQVTDPAREELALALRTSPNSMGNRISAARDLVSHPRLVALVESAAISAWAARLVVLELTDLTMEQGSQVVDQVCTRIAERLDSGRRAWTSAEVGRAARLARRRLCPDSDQSARERAFTRRRVQVFPDKNGMAVLVADLDETDAHRIHRRLSAIARGVMDADDPRTCDQVRADVFVDLLLGLPTPAPTGTAGQRASGAPGGAESDDPDAGDGSERGISHGAPGSATGTTRGPSLRPDIQVIVSLETLLGMADDPAEVPGLGPIPAETARLLAADGSWRAWVTDASGAVAATGSRGYVPSNAVARAVRAREPHCRMPGCRQPSQRCDLDHTVPFPAGTTSAANLGPLCRRHHVLKTHAGWDLQPVPHPESPASTAQAPLAWRWRTPAGFTVPDHPSNPLE